MTPVADVAALAPRYDLVVIGAGPAGLSAAAGAAEVGLSVLLADENPAPGGQIYRAITTTPMRGRAVLSEEYWRGAALAERLARAPVSYAAGCTVWAVTAEPAAEIELGVSLGGRARLIAAAEIVLATGAQERPFAIPGWTLPGVMTAGAAQIALKSSGIVPAGPTVIAGCGPLLYLLASQLVAAGAEVVAVLDTAARANWPKAVAGLPDFLLSPYLAKGLKLMVQARRGVRFIAGVTGLAAEGQGALSSVRYARGRREETISCATLLLHQGVIPGVNLSSAVGCAHDFDRAQHAWVPRLDAWGSSSVPRIAIAGDAAGIGGAESAGLRGEIAALGAAARLGRVGEAERDRRAAPIRTALARALRGRRFLDLLYRPAPQFLAPPDDATIVCRCEEVTAGQLRDTARRLGVMEPNQMKHFLRCGMGPCQGRLCGPTVVELIAETHGRPIADIGAYRLRPPVKPIPLAQLVTLPDPVAPAPGAVR